MRLRGSAPHGGQGESLCTIMFWVVEVPTVPELPTPGPALLNGWRLAQTSAMACATAKYAYENESFWMERRSGTPGIVRQLMEFLAYLGTLRRAGY
jgi:hypothetical protein